MKKQIERIVPLRLVNQLAMTERIKKDHPGNLHLWWNRSPIYSSEEIIKTIFHDNDNALQKKNTVIVDPFSGFGGLAVAAGQAGIPVIAGDLNSVATVLTKAIAEIPSRFDNKKPVSLDAENRIYLGTQGLAEDIRCYGMQIRMELTSRLSYVYPHAIKPDEDGKSVYACLWTRTIPCPNPACDCRMPLVTSYLLSKLKGREYYAHPVIDSGKVVFEVEKGVNPSSKQGNKIGASGAKFQCPVCGEITKDSYVKSIGKSHQLGLQLMAIGVEGPDGREYVSPTKEQISSTDIEIPIDIPIGELPEITRWFSPPLFGLKKYADLYTPRQLIFMTTLCELICNIRKTVFEDAKQTGMADDGISLEQGGTGALAYSEAVSVYLSCLVGKIANFQSEICTWDNRNGNVRAAFTRQAIPMTWVFAEGNPFSTVTGNYDTMLKNIVETVANLPCSSSATVVQGDGTRFEFPNNSILFTELPYYDNVGYADLSDYFYIWMRRCLKDVYPKLFEKVVTSKEELSSIPEHFNGDTIAARQEYEEGIRRLCQNFSKSAFKEYPSIIFFEFGKADEQTMLSDGDSNQENSAWENIVDALVQAGFHIITTLPVRTEKPNDRYETTRVAIIFEKRSNEALQTTRRGFVSELKKKLPDLLQSWYQMDMDQWDRPIVGMGCGLSVFSDYKKIINADGSSMKSHDALKVIWAEVTEYIRELELEETSSEIKEVNHAGEL